ncbi:MAG: FAD-dependent thymidylate synthase [Armatimonadetes bacterium]|nr:FAD-dependent thymidylate synthase [Armatimonadota bacterium]
MQIEPVTPRLSLLASTPDPELLIARAIWVSHHGDSPVDATAAELADLLKRRLHTIIDRMHHSVLEHVSATFLLEGVSRVLTHQLVRHRIASFTQQSLRYVDPTDSISVSTGKPGSLPVVLPPRIAESPKASDVFTGAMQASIDAFAKLQERNVAPATIPLEDVRFVLPHAVATRIVITANLREFRHIFTLRCHEDAQWEIRRVCVEIFRQLRGVMPVFLGDFDEGCPAGMPGEVVVTKREKFPKLSDEAVGELRTRFETLLSK